MSNVDPIVKIKEWLTPGLISVLGVLLLSQLTELKSDVKQLLLNQSANQVKIMNLEADVANLQDNLLKYQLRELDKQALTNKYAKKEDGPEIPKNNN